MVQLQTNLKEIEATGGQVVAISYDSTAILSRFAIKRSITYALLSDPGSKTIDAYGIRNGEAPERVKGIPYPARSSLEPMASSMPSCSCRATKSVLRPRPLSRR